MIRILQETHADIGAREALLDAAFGHEERLAKTCERLREERLPAQGLAFVARDGDVLIGTLRLWEVTAGPRCPSLMLGPLAVDSGYRSQGIGGQLMAVALAAAASASHGSVLLVGDAPYYARFGFDAGLTGRLWLPGPYDRARFLGLELREGTLAGAAGLVSATGRPEPRTLPREARTAFAA